MKPLGLASASAQIVLGNVFVRLLAFVTMPLLTRLLPPDAYGTAAMAMALVGLASVSTLAGADMSYLRASGAKEYISAEQVETFVWRFVIAAAVLAALAAYIIADYVSRGFDWPKYLPLLISASAAASLLQTMAQARARLQGRHAKLAGTIVVSGIVAAGTSIVAAQFVRDALPLVLSIFIGYASTVILLGGPPIGTLVSSTKLSAVQRRDILMIGLPGTATALAYWVISSSDRWFLGQLTDARTTGVYALGSSVGIMGMVVNSAIFTVWTPEAVRLGHSKDKDSLAKLALTSEQLLAWMAFVACAVSAGGGEVISLLAAPAFQDARIVVPFVAGAVWFHGIIHLANAIMLIQKQLHRTVFWWCAGAGLSGLLNYLLIPRIGMLGAAVAFFLSTCFIAIGLTVVATRQLPIRVHWRRVSLVMATSVCAAVVLSIPWSAAPVSSLLLKVPALLLLALALAVFNLSPIRDRLSSALYGSRN